MNTVDATDGGQALTLKVELGDRSYPIHIGEGALSHLPELLGSNTGANNVAIVTDTNVAPLYADQVMKLIEDAGFKTFVCVMTSGEEHKRLSQVEDLCGQFLEHGMDRSSAVVALGGGVVGDTAGFAAAAFMRGIRYIQVPTTIVAQVDSSVGGKTAVNHPLGKNIIGAFHQPDGVLIDLAFLRSLPEREFTAGLAEVIKHGIIADADLFAYMEDEREAILSHDLSALMRPIVRSCEIKGDIVSQDEKEAGIRAHLNYGHTFGHGIEAATHYTRFLHGEAISLGMCAAAELALALGLVGRDFVTRQRSCIEAYGLPVSWSEIPVDATLQAMTHDKKARGGTLKFVVADRMGHVVHRTDVSTEQARKALEAIR